MFAEIVEYDTILERIVEYNLTEPKVNTLLKIINENPSISVKELVNLASTLDSGGTIILDSGTYSVDPILNESKTTNLLEYAIPAIINNIPKEIIGYLTETHARVIVDKILSVTIDDTTTDEQLTTRINEMFSAGNISIPVQGLRKQATSVDVVMNGTFAPLLNKSISFDKGHIQTMNNSMSKNKDTLRSALKDYKMIDTETPLMKILPKFIVALKNLLGDKK